MNRIDKVSEKVKELSAKVRKGDIVSQKDVGYSATHIADLLASHRNNVTTDLNILYRQGKLIKIVGKPTLFFCRESFEKIFHKKLPENNLLCKNLNEFIQSDNKYEESKEENRSGSFKNIIGMDGSLSVVIQQAKAAILYPPSGLPTLIFGETGVGKSTFAEAMYEYGKLEGIFNVSSLFVVFNCADYANNPQLLLAQLFGYSKGAYTGAEKDKPGLIEIADGGVLLLDEVHRLPPEGQEMLFTFIDKGMYRRMGEMNNDRTSRVLIIVATTENPESSLLKAFTRRIPMVIKLPPLRERKLKERFAIIKNLLNIEAVRLKHNIIVDKAVFEAMLTYNPVGNIGQLKSDVQLSVARAFLEFSIWKLENVYVTINFVPEYVKRGLLNLDKEVRVRLDAMLVEAQYCFSSDQPACAALEAPKHDFIQYFYEAMKSSLGSEVNIQKAFRDFTQIVAKNMYSDSRLPDFIDDTAMDMVNLISDVIYNELGIILDRSVYYSLALHFIYITKYDLRNIDCMGIPKDEDIKIKYADVYRTSLSIIKMLEKNFEICCPDFEAYFLTIILSSIKENKIESRVGVLVIAHGEGTASNLADVANTLLGINHVSAINMPLNEKPDTVLSMAVSVVKRLDQGKGVLLLVDMGSLIIFGNTMQEMTGIEIRCIDNISTLTVIEAARKALLPNASLEHIVHSLIDMNQTLNERLKRVEQEYNKKSKRVIYTVCSSGQGTAFYLEKSIKDMLRENQIYDIEVIPLSLINKQQFKKIIGDSAKDKYIVAIVGSVDLMIEAYPFISLPEIVLNNGLKKLLKLVSSELMIYNNDECLAKINKEIIWKVTSEVIEKYLQFLSSEKVLPCIRECLSTFEQCLGVTMKENTMVRAYIHISYMIERILLNGNQLISGVDIEKYIQENQCLWPLVRKSLEKIEKIFNINVSDDEVYFIVELLKD